MNVKDLRYFVAVYEAQSFSRATRTLDTVQSNVSLRIRNLEDFVGEPLFRRRSHGVTPTDRGEKLYRLAKHAIAVMEETERAIRPPRAA